MNTDFTQYYSSGSWAIAADDVQWVLQEKRKDNRWRNRVYISTDVDILARCMRELDVPIKDSHNLLLRLSKTFKEWQATQPTPDANNSLDQLKTPAKGTLNGK